MNIFQSHIAFNQIADYAEGRLQPDVQLAVEAHLAGCPKCYEKVTQLIQLIARMRSDASQEAPAFLIHRTVQLFHSKNARPIPPSGLRHLILAVLQFDSLDLSPGSGMRMGRSSARQILYRAGGNEIDVHIEPADQEWIVSGQVFGEAAVSNKVILQGKSKTSQTALNKAREFVLPPVQEGVYTLILNLEEVDVQINDIWIGP